MTLISCFVIGHSFVIRASSFVIVDPFVFSTDRGRLEEALDARVRPRSVEPNPRLRGAVSAGETAAGGCAAELSALSQGVAEPLDAGALRVSDGASAGFVDVGANA